MKLKTCPSLVVQSLRLFFFSLFFVLNILFLNVSEAKAEETLHFIHQDHLGSTSIVTNETGDVIDKQVYYPYGGTRQIDTNSQINTNGQTIERQYTSQVSDEDDTGLYYYNARYYNPNIAKFTQADTANDGLNRYAYVANNPVKFIDPSGHQGCVDCHSTQNFESVENIPEWYTRALVGDYSLVPPMGFRHPSDMFEYGDKYGLVFLFMRGEQAMRQGKGWEDFNSSLSDWELNRYWEETYEKEKEILQQAYPQLEIEFFTKKDVEEGRVSQYTGAYYTPDSSTITLPEHEYRPLTKITLMQHEATHFIDIEILGEVNIVNSEINARFTQLNIPYTSLRDRWVPVYYLNAFTKLRKVGFSDDFIMRIYNSHKLLEFTASLDEPVNHIKKGKYIVE